MSKKIQKRLFLASMGLFSSASLIGVVACSNKNDEETGADLNATLSDSDKRVQQDKLSAFLEKIPEAKRNELANLIKEVKTLNDVRAIDRKFEEILGKDYYQRLKTSLDFSRGFTQDESSEILLATTFGDSGRQKKAIDKLIREYNLLVDEMLKIKKNNSLSDDQKDAMYKQLGISSKAKKVKNKPLGSGYPVGAEKVSLGLRSKDKKLFNLIINYPTVAAKLADANMLLSFNSLDAENDVDISLFDNNFTKVNGQIEKSKQIGTFVLPIFKSTNVLAINKPVLGYILQTFKDKDVKFNTADGSDKFFNDIINDGQTDKATVATLWGTAVANADEILAKYKKKDYLLSKNIFDSYSELLEFSNVAQKLFENSKKGVESNVHVFGIDDMVGVYETALYASTNANDKTTLQTTRKDKGVLRVDYSNIKNKTSTTYRNSSDIFNKFSTSFKEGAAYAFPSGQYSSGDQVKHRFAFSIGSTAGYSHNFKEKDKTQTIFKDSSTNFEIDVDSRAGVKVFGKRSDEKPDKNKLKEKYDAKLAEYENTIITFGGGKFLNNIYKSTFKGGDEYDYKSKDATNDGMFEKLAKDSKLNSYLSISFEKSRITGNVGKYVNKLEKILKDQEKTSSTQELFKYSIVSAVDDKKEYVVYVFKGYQDSGKGTNPTLLASKQTDFKSKYSLTQEILSDTGLLNENELLSYPTPGKWEPKNQKVVTYVQGPSLIGVKANEADDDATRAFVKWLISSTKKINTADDRKPKEEKYTPLEFLQNTAGYITTVKELDTKDDTYLQNIAGKNEYLKIAFNQFKDTVKNKNHVIFEEPAGLQSDAFRKQIGSAWETVQANYSNKAKPSTFDDFVGTLSTGTN
ncbi:P68 family surface lipoprotein [Mycoplasmopsis cynos]|uniref:P68 family surface lipoprotein n=1 Tax=Mycoplasmopsis cynos TaxID=171284 RepID=UPI002AFFF070|nr:P80 family lipoprotein [Mycoplasmopsis cynos]WQQ14998.1 P80 family lipoprotein [Mycoplasmopsis cynos]